MHISYDKLINEVFTKIAPKYDDLSEEFVKEVSNYYDKDEAITRLFKTFYDQTMTADDDDFFEGYIDEDTGENTRTYDMEWVENQFVDDDSWRDYYLSLQEKSVQ